MNLLFEIHQDLPREGPGDNASTRRAFSLIAPLPSDAVILDVGCGPGAQTIELARHIHGRIVAVDTHGPYLHVLRQRTAQEGVSENIALINASMFTLPLVQHSVDVIWSEGAIYLMGFERGLQAWRQFLKPGGHVAVTELSWLRTTPPTEAQDFWRVNYPEMRTIRENLDVIAAADYQEVGHFVLPESSWWEDYYTPLERRIADLRERYQGDPDAIRQLDAEQLEIDLYRKYSDCYGYVFYVMRTP